MNNSVVEQFSDCSARINFLDVVLFDLQFDLPSSSEILHSLRIMLETYDGFTRKVDYQFKDLENEKTTNTVYHAGSQQTCKRPLLLL